MPVKNRYKNCQMSESITAHCNLTEEKKSSVPEKTRKMSQMT